MMGLGIALYEEGDFDPKSGILLNSDIHQYRIPSSLETPDIQTFTVEADDVHYPYSGKPVGEAPLMGVLPAVRNAIFHATGIKVNELPISSAKILELEAN
jgi:xanthine dehydrogenase molybdenum-binding subunit